MSKPKAPPVKISPPPPPPPPALENIEQHLLGCPFCPDGGVPRHGSEFRIYCRRCGAMTAPGSNEREAEDSWNSRANVSDALTEAHEEIKRLDRFIRERWAGIPWPEKEA